MAAKPTPQSAEADLAFLRAVVEGGGKPSITLAIAYLAGGLLYGLQCLFQLGQFLGLIVLPGLVTLVFLVSITLAFLAVLIWAIRKDSRDGVGVTKGPVMSRALNAGFSGAGMANAAVIIVFGVGAARDQDFAVWLYYPAVIFALQAAAWYMAFALKKKRWMLATSIGGWLTAVALGLLVREPFWYLVICNVALFALFALPGWIMYREARGRTAKA